MADDTNLDFITTTASTTTTTTSYTYIIIGCSMAILGNLLISVSLTIQKYAHLNAIDTETYTHSKLWWLGIVLMGIGETGNFGAYGFAPASVVAPLGSACVIANMFLAVIVLKEKLRAEDLFGCSLAIVGAFLVVTFSTKDDSTLSASDLITYCQATSFIVYMVVELIALIILFTLLYRFELKNVLVLLLITSIMASYTVISAKGVSGMIELTIGGNMQLTSWIFYVFLVVMLISIFFQVKFLNDALKLFDNTVVVPTNFVFFSISAIIAGIVFYKEFWGMSALSIFMFLFGCIMCFVGVYFITAGRGGDSGFEAAQEKLRSATTFMPTWLLSGGETVRQRVQPPMVDDMSRPIIAAIGISDSESFDDTASLSRNRAETPVTRPKTPPTYGTNGF